MDNKIALNSKNSVVVEACAGSGKTWLLVSRIVRLLLDGVKPDEILAITFTRKAAQEMQSRLNEWLHLLAVEDDAVVTTFLQERGLDVVDDAMLTRARSLYRNLLLAHPSITISTFHGWFMQIIQKAPLNAGVPVGMQLLERTSTMRDEAWESLADTLRKAPDGEMSGHMQWLFSEFGLHSTRGLLENFVNKRAEWWAYTQGQANPVDWAITELLAELGIDPDADYVGEAFVGPEFEDAVQLFATMLETGTDTQCKSAAEIKKSWSVVEPHARFDALVKALYTQAGEPRSFKPTKKQDAVAFQSAFDEIFFHMEAVRNRLLEQMVWRTNQAALHCGAALLANYQELKMRSQQLDFTDLEWQVCRLLNQSECVEYMQFKLDSRYKHVLLDEFQDTNPLQWQILQSWFAAAAAVDLRPTIFVVGDPKQSIYRFRRADARLFGVVREFLEQEFGAHYLTQNETRRNSPAVLDAVNSVFRTHPDGFVDFDEHVAYHQTLPGHVEVMPLLEVDDATLLNQAGLRNPLTTPLAEEESGARELEAKQFAAKLVEIVETWNIQNEDGTARRAQYGDIMVLVRKRTNLRVYEHALRACKVPFLTSRRGGLLDTLEAEDIQALLTFLITPFADLELAQVLKSPLLACNDSDLILLASADGIVPVAGQVSSWWDRVQLAVLDGTASAELRRAYRLLQGWLKIADKCPVHDLLDRIYYEGDLLNRYAAVLPAEMFETVHANLLAFMEIALNVDSGRYPSLTRFLSELRDLRGADNESPDEGKVGEVGNAVRIYTVHEAKGLEAPIVWLLDTNDAKRRSDSYSVLLDWQPNEPCPAHFSVYAEKKARGNVRAPYFDADEAYSRREEMNLLYVAMTRAKQALIVSGNEKLESGSWYDRISEVVTASANPLVTTVSSVNSLPMSPAADADEAVAMFF